MLRLSPNNAKVLAIYLGELQRDFISFSSLVLQQALWGLQICGRLGLWGMAVAAQGNARLRVCRLHIAEQPGEIPYDWPTKSPLPPFLPGSEI